jgi:hypothetical protein
MNTETLKELPGQKTVNLGLFQLKLLTPVVVERVRRWIDALRSGMYAQGHGELETLLEDKCLHCCLGVAKVVCQLPEKGKATLTHTFQDLGLTSEWGRLANLPYAPPIQGKLNLTNLNDNEGWNFTELAALIEDQLAVCLKEKEGSVC